MLNYCSYTMNEEAGSVTNPPRIIFVKEYVDESTKNETRSRAGSSTPNDERIISRPLNLEENASLSSSYSTISLPANQDVDIKQSPSLKEKCINVINGHALQFLGVVIICILSFGSITLLPYHNVILNPSYWYESIFIYTLGAFPGTVGVFILHAKVLMKKQELARPSFVVKLVFLWAGLCTIGHSLLHFLWSFYLEYNSPTPFSFVIVTLFILVICLTSMWKIFPPKLKNSTAFQDQYNAYWYYSLWIVMVPNAVPIIVESVKVVSTFTGCNINWTIAILLLLFKKKSNSIMVNYLSKVVIQDNKGLAKGIVTIENGVMFKSIILVLIGSKTDSATAYWYTAISVLLNMKLCIHIIQLHKQKLKRKKEVLTTLILNETSEFFTTLAYVLATSIAFYGPNANLIGNIKNNYWQFYIIESFSDFLADISYSIIIDFSCGVITLIVLWVTCSINGLLFFKDKMAQYGYAIAFYITVYINYVSFNINTT